MRIAEASIAVFMLLTGFGGSPLAAENTIEFLVKRAAQRA